MKREMMILVSLVLMCVAGFSQRASAQVEKVDYLWLVDVSGERNIYLEGVQHAIDTFYVVASKHDMLHVYNFAKTVATKDDLVDTDFYQYSDMGQMVCALDSLISHSYSRYVRAFILSDFFHHSPTGVQERLNPEAYSDVRNHLNEICRTKNVAISLLVLPILYRDIWCQSRSAYGGLPDEQGGGNGPAARPERRCGRHFLPYCHLYYFRSVPSCLSSVCRVLFSEINQFKQSINNRRKNKSH